MTCQEVNEFLDDFLAGTLPWRQRLSFQVHLLLCRRCRQYLASYSATIMMTQSVVERPAEPIPEELVHAILAARRNTPGSKADNASPESGE